MKLSILLSTINDRIYAAEQILLQQFADTEIIVIHQLTGDHKESKYSEFYLKFTGKPITFISLYEKGISKSRNAAMKNASGELLYICDDDVIFKPDFFEIIIKADMEYPAHDIFTFKIETTEGRSFKNYSATSFNHIIRTSASVSSIEIVIRRSAFQKEFVKFDERFGLASEFETGEEFIMLTDALKKGSEIRYIPQFIVQHPANSSGKNYSKSSAYAKGAMIARVYGWKYIIINGLFAIRKFDEYRQQIGFITFMKNIYKGSLNYLRNV